MYLKVAGCAFIVLGSSVYGYLKGLEYKKHVDELYRLRKIIWQTEGEIRYTKAPLNEVLRRVRKKTKAPYQEWLSCLIERIEKNGGGLLGELWQQSVEQTLEAAHLTKEERAELGMLGGQMGYLDSRMQEQTLSWYAGKLEDRQKKLEKELQQKQRLCVSLGIMAGLFLTIVLV